MFLLAALLLGCVGAAVAADLSREIVYRMADGRQYAVSNPQDVTSGIPLILYFHGINCGCTRTTGDILDAAAQQGFRALIGSVCGVNGAWDVNGNSDVDYTKRVINDIASRYSIDRSKVFLAGWSMGGMMTSHLACVDASFVAGVAMVSCGFGCSNPPVKTNIIGIQGIYDSVCSEWVTNAYNSWAPAMGCPAGSGDVRKQVCSGKKLDLHRVVGPHLYLDVADQVAFFKEIAGGSVGPTCTAPANPANGHFTCAGTTCTLICDNGFAATGAGQSTCVNGAWSSLPACVPSGAGSQACGLVSENNAMSLSCATGQVINAVEFASYGQPQGSCSASGIGACHAASSLSAVQAACAGKSSCSVNAANSVFGDPCPGTNKQLAVRAHCAAATTVCASGSEWATLTVTCPAGSNIMGVSFASYGTPATATCGSFATGACHAASSLDVVQKTCVGKNTCSFAGGQMNAAFGDPCSGTGKTLAIQALCS